MIENFKTEMEMVERHFDVLETVIEEQPIGIVKLSQETGYQRHEVRYSLRMLEEEGIIEPSKQGAVTADEASGFLQNHDNRIDGVIDRFEQLPEIVEQD